MTRKDYVLLSATIRDVLEAHRATLAGDGVIWAAQALAHALVCDNRAFDPERFLRDCGVAS